MSTRVIVSVVVGILFALPLQSAWAQPAAPRTPAEDFVLARLASGDEADLSHNPDAGGGDPRVLSGAFVADLLTNSIDGVQIHRNGIHIVNAIVKGPVSISGAELPYEVSITHSQFDAITVTHSLFKKSVTMDWSRFGTADFGSTDFSSGAYFSHAQFAGAVSFRYSNVKNVLIAAGAQFLDTEHGPDLNSATFSSGLFLYDAEFHGGVDLASVHTSYLDLTRAHFWPAKTSCSLLADDGDALFDSATFSGPLDCGNAVIKGDLTLNKAQLNDVADFSHSSIGTVSGDQVFSRRGLVFDRARIGGDVTLSKLVSTGSVRFNAATIGGDVALANLQILHADAGLGMGNAHIQGNVVVMGGVVDGPVSLAASEMLGLDMRETQFRSDKAADFSATRITRDGSFEGTEFDGPTYFSNASFGLGVSFIGARLPPQRQMFVDGLSYRDLYLKATDDSRAVLTWQEARAFFDQAKYWPSNYVDLESYFKRLGHLDDADQAYEEGRRLQRPNVYHDGGFDVTALPGSVFDLTLDRALCYGRCPRNALLPALVIVVIGAVIFRRKDDMQPKDTTGVSFWYNPLVYSLDLFAPVINLGARDVWIANQTKRGWARWYESVQMLAGWLIVPIGLAALTGLFK